MPLVQALFVTTGTIITLGYQWIFYAGAGGRGLAMITVLPSYIGMCMPLAQPAVFRRFLSSSYPMQVHLIVIFASVLDIAGGLLTAVGLFMTGSGIYQVLYSSVVVFTALVARIVLHKPLSWKQWLAVIIVNTGLALSAGSGDADNLASSNIFVGSAFILLGTVLIAAAYVTDQGILDKGLMDGKLLCLYTGLYSTFLTLLYMLFYTAPRWEELIASQVMLSHGHYTSIVCVFLFLCGVNALHNAAYFHIVEEVGSVVAGLMQSLRAVVVFFASALLYCHLHQEQCMNTSKLVSAFIVVGGVVLFILNPLREDKNRSPSTSKRDVDSVL